MSEELNENNAIGTEPHPIDEIMADLYVYQEPEMINEKDSHLIDNSRANMGDLKRYVQMLSNIDHAWKKTQRYGQYFAYFYPDNDSVERVEALNHHIHAYLQDMDTDPPKK